MNQKNIKILISVGLIIAALAVAYLLDFSKWKDINSIDGQISQTESLIKVKQAYYAVIDSKMQALNSSGWDSKKNSIMINFDSSLFFTPKINTFFKTIVASSGMKLSGMTSSSAESVRAQAQVQTTTIAENGAKSSKDAETTQQVVSPTNYLDRLQGEVKKTTISLTVTGTYSAFKNLLSLFENQTRIITVKSVSVSSATQEGTKTKVNNLSFNLVLDVYSY
jgi:hypothetical protein